MKKINDPLAAYKQKRDFTKTSEPLESLEKEATPLIFIVQKHSARNLHYDLRLEMDGVLKSWAVPKGPSLDPAQKRLAVRVEDHPLAYAEFEGVIPENQYGAGSVIIWDRGTWEPIGDPREGLKKGHLKFRLQGKKLQGAWGLVQLRGGEDKKNHWLLIKERDDHARLEKEFNVLTAFPDRVVKLAGTLTMPAEAKLGTMPLSLAPQLATLVDHPPLAGDWIYEIKFDGYRILTRIDQGDVRLFTRNGLDWTDKLKSLAEEIRGMNLASGWLDGELVILGKDGLPDFGALQSAFETKNTKECQYFIFDIPYYAGFDLRETSLTARRKLLSDLLTGSDSDQIRFSEDFGARGGDILRSACAMGLEGLIGKKKDSPYVPGRSQNWIKLKCRKRQEFVVMGYTKPKGQDRGIGALLLGYYDSAGNLRYAGKTGTGFDIETTFQLREKLSQLSKDRSAQLEGPENRDALWVAPVLVAEVSFSKWTKDGKLREAVFHGLRNDKPAALVRKEASKNVAAFSDTQGTEDSGTKISNPDRVIDSSTGLKKIDLVDYYLLASKWILPQLKDRPVAFLRAPEGIEGEQFFQKHRETLRIPGLKELDIPFNPKHPPLMGIDSHPALIGAVQMNVIEFHTYNFKTTNIEKPDRMVFDLDLGEGIQWPDVQEAADLIRIMLEELDLLCFLKTSGGKGLHIIVPLTPRDDWDTVKSVSKAVAEHLAKVIPGRFTAISGPRNRKGKIFVDYLRNHRGATTVAAFSARARPGMGVSMPCSWKELADLTGGAHWTVSNARTRLDLDQDPWKDYAKTKQTLSALNKKLLLQR